MALPISDNSISSTLRGTAAWTRGGWPNCIIRVDRAHSGTPAQKSTARMVSTFKRAAGSEAALGLESKGTSHDYASRRGE